MKFTAVSTLLATFSLALHSANAELLRRRTASVCTLGQIMEFDCDIRDDVVGVYVCRGGATTCVDPEATLAADTCGCCAGDNRPDCIDDGDSFLSMGNGAAPVNMTNFTASVALEATTDEAGICSAFQIAEFDCDIADDVVGVYVCRAGATTCVLASNTMPTDTCGCCAGDTNPECIDDGDGLTGLDDTTAVSRESSTGAGGICSAFQIAEFDCDIADDVVGVYVCRGGATMCVLASNTMPTDTCGCCAGDTSPECMDDGDGWNGDDGDDWVGPSGGDDWM